MCLRCVGDLLPGIQCNSLLPLDFLEQFEKNASIENSMPEFRLIVGLKTCDNNSQGHRHIFRIGEWGGGGGNNP